MSSSLKPLLDNSVLSTEQLKAFQLYKDGKNIFITGPGGSGKSLLIKHIYQDAIMNGKYIQVCATTGRAALLLDCKAKTVHSWSGIGLAKGNPMNIGMKISENKKKKAPWMTTDVLIVDEISMMSVKIFELLDYIGKKIRKSTQPFGGIQILFFGDFYQLPPVGNKEQDPSETMFCFESPLWFNTFPKENHILLTHVFRQKCEIYAKILNKLRLGTITKSGLEHLNSRVGLNMDTIEIQPTKLFPTKRIVESINKDCLDKIHSETCVFISKVAEQSELVLNEYQQRHYNNLSRMDIERELEYLENNMNADKRLELKVGAQVMCVVNLDMDSDYPVCNGSIGIVTDIIKDIGIKVKFINGSHRLIGFHYWKSELNEGIAIKQIPLVLAWAMTIHKSQGSTLDCAEIDAGSNIFEAGQTYVALSRVKSLDGLYLTSFDITKIKVNKKVKQFYESLV
jgi:ATP-dependent DNA helicase PIF1